MIERIIAFSAHNRFFVIFLTIAALFGAGYSMRHMPLDAIPDLSDTQVIIYSRWDRSPDILEDQVTYPIVTSLLGAPKVKAVRGFSDFGFSYVYVIFEDGTDLYWARSRVLEYLSKIQNRLPEGVRTELGPDATGVGWVYQYALVDRTGRHDLAELRSLQDWTLRYLLQSVPGVAEVASIGGFQKQYQIQVDPQKLKQHRVPLSWVVEAVRRSNNDTGARLVEFAGAEYMIRGRGYATSIHDIEQISVGQRSTPYPVLVKDIGRVVLGPDIRRGVSDLDGLGDTVGGIIVMRQGENALNVIRRVKARIEELKPSLPAGVEIMTTYDRSTLILQAIDTLKHELVMALVIVSLVILIFLWHLPSAIVPILTIPISVALAFIPMYFMGITTNLMSLSGIAISIGVLVDGAIVEVENAYKRLEEWVAGGRIGDYHAVRLHALQEVGPSVFFSLLVIAVAFLPIFTLVDQEGRLFKPLAISKNLAMAIAALLAITLDPAIRMLFTREPKVGEYRPEHKHPISKRLFRVYEPLCRWVLNHPRKTLATAGVLVLTTIPVFLKLGSEFMPPLYEGSLLFMPTTMPGISVGEAQKLMQTQDQILMQFPEVERVFGKAGRAETATDPAPFSMMETTILLKHKSQWRKGLTKDKLVDEMNAALQIPGVTNAWTMPIKNRIDMLSTGIRTPIGIKILGRDLETIQSMGLDLEKILKSVPGTRSVFAERAVGGYFLDFKLRRDRIALHEMTAEDVEEVLRTAIGGEAISTTIEGRERYTISVRYPRELRDTVERMKNIDVYMPSSIPVKLGELADIEMKSGPSMIRNENGLLTGYVYIDITGRDIGTYVKDAKEAVRQHLQPREGYTLLWSGQYENMLRVRERLKIVIPFTLVVIFILLYLNTKSAMKAGIVMLAVPFSLIGAFWLLYFLDYNLSIAVWVGMIALMGLDAETGVFMLLFLDISYEKHKREGRLKTLSDLNDALVEGAVKRIRPKLMTVCASFMGLLPILFASGLGADMMKRVAAPMIGGLATSFVLELLIYPVVYQLWKGKELK